MTATQPRLEDLLWGSRGMFGCHCDDITIPTLHVSDSARVIYLDGSKR